MSERRMPQVEDYPSNAHGSDETKPTKLRGSVKRKSSIFRSVRDEFISEDADSMGSYLLHDILFPALRDLINDICHGAIDAAFGGGGSYHSRDRRRRNSYISYDRYYDDDRRRRRRDRDDDDDRPRRRVKNCSEYLFQYRDDADDIFDMMCDQIEKYGEVTVAWFFDKVGEDPGSWNGDDWGWTNLAGVKVRGSNRNGWYIDLPRAKEL